MANDNQGDAFSKTARRKFQRLSARRLQGPLEDAERRGRIPVSPSKWASLHMTKDTQKALAIIIAALGVLVGLLFWANHLRPHP